MVSLQHEFGLNGGKNGEYILSFVERIKKPLVTTFHTILEQPSPNQKEIIKRIADKSTVVIVMVTEAIRRLTEIYGIDRKKVLMIHHGVPDIPLGGSEKFKEKTGLKGRKVASTINLISRNKGIEYAIEAIAKVAKLDPTIIYLVIGRTHPVVARFENENYRHELEALVKKYKIEENVRFLNRYIPIDQLVDYLRATDIYITPYLDPQQITSGALAYAVGAGKSCISTPYIYAQEVLAKGRGILTDFASSAGIADEMVYLINNPKEMREMEMKAYDYGRHMTWSNVALQHLDLLRLVAKESREELAVKV